MSLSFHEAAHAFVANLLGDPTARYSGRLTLNPLAHLDPIGSLMILLAGFGWAKPVPFNPLNLRNLKRDAALISFAGPAANLALAAIFGSFYRWLGGGGALGGVLTLLAIINLNLAVFNLIPLHPLDGFKVVTGLLPRRLAVDWEQTQGWGIYILILLLVTGAFVVIISGPVSWLSHLILGF